MEVADGEWPPSQVLEIALPSNLVNFLNFIVFDILLISLVFYFTTELSGRLNYVALSDGSPKRLNISCPPFVGGGLCSTSRIRIYAMLFIRIVSFLLIFASNLAIDGYSRPDVVKNMGLRLVPGSIENVSAIQLRTLINRRASCQTSRNGFMYFGELRENNVCQFKLSLLSDPVSVSLTPLKLISSTGSCRPKNEPFPNRTRVSLTTYRCDNALIQCIMREYGPPEKRFEPQNCRGVVRREGKTYACNIFSTKQGDSWTGDCREIRNFDVTNEIWLPGLPILYTRITETIGATTIAREANRTLKSEGSIRPVTQVHHAWLALLGAKVLLVLALGCFTAYLVWDGAICVVHDERSLASLLTSSVSRFVTSVHDDSPLYLNAQKSGNKTTFWVSKYPFRKRTNEDRHKLEEEIVMGAR